jgi:hypothetical protein
MMYIYPKIQLDMHFAVAILTVHCHKFNMQIIFLDQLLVFELSVSLLGAAGIWNS